MSNKSTAELIKGIDASYNYQQYQTPRNGLFKVETGEYKYPEGWVQEEKEYTIIGETNDNFIERLIDSGHGEWLYGEVIQHKYTLPIGPHKSRFIKWITTQVQLFKNE